MSDVDRSYQQLQHMADNKITFASIDRIITCTIDEVADPVNDIIVAKGFIADDPLVLFKKMQTKMRISL